LGFNAPEVMVQLTVGYVAGFIAAAMFLGKFLLRDLVEQ
jgi:biotin transporter BioY